MAKIQVTSYRRKKKTKRPGIHSKNASVFVKKLMKSGIAIKQY